MYKVYMIDITKIEFRTKTTYNFCEPIIYLEDFGYFHLYNLDNNLDSTLRDMCGSFNLVGDEYNKAYLLSYENFDVYYEDIKLDNNLKMSEIDSLIKTIDRSKTLNKLKI